MSPIRWVNGESREQRYGGLRASSVWRALIVATMLALGVMAVVLASAVSNNHKALDQTQVLGCRLGGFLVGAPVVKTPGITHQQFDQQLDRAVEFLRALKNLDCSGIGHVTTAKLNKQIATIQKVRGGGAGGNPGGPPGGGNPPPATTPTPPPQSPGPVHRIEQRICHLNPLGVRVCVST